MPYFNLIRKREKNTSKSKKEKTEKEKKLKEEKWKNNTT